ncbi:MAG: CopG family transcriptional regulator [Egibacteraceae bacterium]
MKRTTIMLPDELDTGLRLEASRRGIALADVAREAIAAYLAREQGRRRLSFIGIGDGAADDSGHLGDLVREAVGRDYAAAAGA